MTTLELPRFLIQRGPDSVVEPCTCGAVFAVLRVGAEPASLLCAECGREHDAEIIRFWESPRACRPGPCPCRRRVVVPRVREEVSAAETRNGAERWDAFCVACGEKDGSVPKDALRGFRTARRRDKNAHQRVEILERAGKRCELCCKAGVALDVAHCLSASDARAMGVGPEVCESDWNKCALCTDCNGAAGGYGERSMSPSTYCDLVHTKPEARTMLDFGVKGPRPVDPMFYRIYTLLRQRYLDRTKEAA